MNDEDTLWLMFMFGFGALCALMFAGIGNTAWVLLIFGMMGYLMLIYRKAKRRGSRA